MSAVVSGMSKFCSHSFKPSCALCPRRCRTPLRATPVRKLVNAVPRHKRSDGSTTTDRPGPFPFAPSPCSALSGERLDDRLGESVGVLVEREVPAIEIAHL